MTHYKNSYSEHRRRKRLIKIASAITILAAVGTIMFFSAPYLAQAINETFPQVTPTPTLAPTPASNTKVETEIFKLINTERANRGLPELSKDDDLAIIARAWSSELALAQELSHGNLTQRLEQINGYDFGYLYGEIIESYQCSTEPATQLARVFVDGWLDSPSHRDIMLTATSGSMGVGAGRSYGTLYSVVDFKFSN